MYKHILVATDGSALSLRAVRTAAKLARATKARVTAIHVMQPFDARIVGESMAYRAARLMREHEAGVRANATEVLQKAAATVKSPCDSVAVFDHRPWQAIVRTAAKRGCDVIVMASHGRGRVGNLLLGSETQKVLSHSKTPVLVCR